MTARPGRILAATLLLTSVRAVAQDAVPIQLPDIDVIGVAPMTAGAERDLVPANTQSLRREDLERTGPASALRALDERVGGVSLDDAQGNPFQPNVTYRGFEASPLAGNPQGLAVYLNGTRFNAPFGDTTNWDLIPDIAIDRIELVGANPVFGLNALGGAVSVRLRDGFAYHGAQLELSGGSFGRVQASGQYGQQIGNTAAYIAATGLNETGWRDHSPSQLRQVYADLGWRGDTSELHLSLLGADNILTGNGSTPVELLTASRSAVFTYPDETRNKYLRATLSGSVDLDDRTSLQATAYYSNLSQRTLNGNAADAQSCAANPGVLCTSDGTPLTTRGGGAIPDTLQGGTYAQLDQTATDSNGYGASLQLNRRTTLWGRPNRLLLGASLDGGSTLFSARSSLGALTLDRDYAGPGIVIDQADASITPVRLAAENRYYGVYAQDALDLTDALTLTLSGRLNVAAIRLRDQTGTALSGNHDFTHVNPAAGLTYKILPSLTAYAGYAIANRAPTPAELSCASPADPCSLTNFFVADPALKQVVSATAEAGLRGRFDLDGAHIAWNAGLFRTVSDDDIQFISSLVNGRGYFMNVGQTRRQGVEAGLTLRQGPITAYLDYAYTNATFRTPFDASSPNNPYADANGFIHVAAGDQIPGIPQHRLKFGLQSAVTPRWTVGVTGVLSSGRVLQGDESNLNARTGSYTVLNLDTKYRLTEQIELFGLVQNLFDTRYATFGSFSPVQLIPAAQLTNTRSLTLGPPLAGYGGVRVTF